MKIKYTEKEFDIVRDLNITFIHLNIIKPGSLGYMWHDYVPVVDQDSNGNNTYWFEKVIE